MALHHDPEPLSGTVPDKGRPMLAGVSVQPQRFQFDTVNGSRGS